MTPAIRTAAKAILWGIGLTFGLLVLAAILTYLSLRPARKEVASVPSPDGALIATVETDSGWYAVYITDPNGLRKRKVKIASVHGAFRANCEYGVDLEWASNERLLIKYEGSSVSDQELREVLIGGRFVDIKHVREEFSAQCSSTDNNLNETPGSF